MKLLPSCIGAAAAVALAFPPARMIAQEPEIDPAAGAIGRASTISITEETFSLPLLEADQLLHDVPTDAARYKRLRELVANGKAKLERLLVLRTKSGQRAVVESIREMKYPAEFGPSAKSPASPAEKDPAKPDPKADQSFPVNPSNPTAFDTRNVGDTLELEPVVGPDGMTIDVNLLPQAVRFMGDRTFGGPRPVKQPIFETSKLTTSVAVRDGQPYFLGTLNPPFGPSLPGEPPKEQRVWLDFLTVNLLDVGDLPEDPADPDSKATVARAQKMRVAKLEFRETSVVEAAEFLHKKSVELDPEKKGLEFLLKAPPNLLQTKITLSLKDVSLLEAARAVAKLAALLVVPEENGLLLRAAGEKP